ncbi:MAG: WYL domain-containing protein [Promicromonosporaceae bacterium]|nr:WYL domain-containing protein [Promicromonosporaceae bacterium]
MPAERSADAVVRLLGLVSYLAGRGPVPISQLAQRFNVSGAQIRADIDQLWVTGTPGYWPHDLLDFDGYSIERGMVHLTEARGLTQPLRLATREAVALIAALRALAGLPALQADPARREVAASALAKLEAVAGTVEARLDVTIAAPETAERLEILTVITAALNKGHRLRLRYSSAADRVSQREVDPGALVTERGVTYLRAWCSQARARRTFRLDRILAAEVLDEPSDPIWVAEARKVGPPPGEGDTTDVTLVLGPQWRWFAETLTVGEVSAEFADGSFALRLPVSDEAWWQGTLLWLAPGVSALEPPAAARAATVEARAALAAYGLDEEE